MGLVRYVALAVLAGTFWLIVATVRLILHPPLPPVVPVAAPYVASPRFEPAPPQVRDFGSRRGEYFRASAADPQGGGCALPFDDEVVHITGLRRLPRSVLIAGLDAVRPQVQACYVEHGVPGMALVNVHVALDGSVRSARVTGKFARTPTGACVEAAVKTARFPPSARIVMPYRFQLR